VKTRHPLTQRGFTLIELLVTIVIAAILLAVALPSFLSSIQSRQASAIANDLMQDIAWARGSAISGAQNVSLTLQPNCSWASAEGSPAASVPLHSKTLQQASSQAPGASCSGVPASGLVLSFDSLGMVSTAGSVDTVVTVTTPQGASVQLQIFASGMVVENSNVAS
jgi:prepilin-type N-terminal cleavage/methylation domain-containing protein